MKFGFAGYEIQLVVIPDQVSLVAGCLATDSLRAL
jgi:hypothetical protein